MKKEIKGIYLIERIETVSDETKKYYVGQALDIFNRFNQHCTEIHPGIDAAITKLGSDKFSFRILEIVEFANDLNACETKWINLFKENYGDELMYNIAQTTNTRTEIDPTIKEKVKILFNEDIGRSIYAIAEYFSIPYKDVIEIRKPLLKKKGLKWKNGKIIDINGVEPENWRGYQLTKKLSEKINTMLNTPGYSKKDIRSVSSADLEIYLKSGKEYCYASEIEKQ